MDSSGKLLHLVPTPQEGRSLPQTTAHRDQATRHLKEEAAMAEKQRELSLSWLIDSG